MNIYAEPTLAQFIRFSILNYVVYIVPYRLAIYVMQCVVMKPPSIALGFTILYIFVMFIRHIVRCGRFVVMQINIILKANHIISYAQCTQSMYLYVYY